MPESDMVRLAGVKDSALDSIDRQIVHALTVEPRVSFRTLAEVTGVSDQTAARRYRELVRSAGLSVLAVVDGPRAGWVDWHVRLQTTPGSAEAIAIALAKRADTRWVRLYSGGTEVMCVLQARTAEERDALLLEGLPGSRRVVQISAQCVLKSLATAAWSGLQRALSVQQLALLHRVTVVPDADVRLESSDEPLLAELARDGRTPVTALASAINWHESTVRRRIDELEMAGLLYFDLDIDDRLYGSNLSAMLWLSVEPAHLEAVGKAVAAHPEVPFVGITTGTTNLVISGQFRDTQHLYEYLTGRLAGLEGIRSVETSPVIRTLKRSGALRPRWTSA
jgi:DNA-binding Lrp family transcriptional regulator